MNLRLALLEIAAKINATAATTQAAMSSTGTKIGPESGTPATTTMQMVPEQSI